MLAAILSNVGALVGRLTSVRAGYLDKLNVSGAKVADAAYYTDARGPKLDNLDATISSRASSTSALSNADWTTARAGYLDNIKKIPQVQLTNASIVEYEYASSTAGAEFVLTGFSTVKVDADKKFGLRRYQVTPGSTGAYVDIVNISDSGWVHGIMGFQGQAGSITYGIKTIIDGSTVNETSYAAHAQNTALHVLATPVTIASTALTALATVPIRFDATLQVQIKTADIAAALKGTVICSLD